MACSEHRTISEIACSELLTILGFRRWDQLTPPEPGTGRHWPSHLSAKTIDALVLCADQTNRIQACTLSVMLTLSVYKKIVVLAWDFGHRMHKCSDIIGRLYMWTECLELTSWCCTPRSVPFSVYVHLACADKCPLVWLELALPVLSNFRYPCWQCTQRVTTKVCLDCFLFLFALLEWNKLAHTKSMSYLERVALELVVKYTYVENYRGCVLVSHLIVTSLIVDYHNLIPFKIHLGDCEKKLAISPTSNAPYMKVGFYDMKNRCAIRRPSCCGVIYLLFSSYVYFYLLAYGYWPPRKGNCCIIAFLWVLIGVLHKLVSKTVIQLLLLKRNRITVLEYFTHRWYALFERS